MEFYKSAAHILLSCLLLVALTESVPVPTTKVKKAKSVSVFKRHPTAMINPAVSAIASKIHKNAILASAFQMPHTYVPMGGIGMGAGLTSYQSYAGGVAAPYGYGGYGGGYDGYSGYGGYGGMYAPYTPAAYSTNHGSSYYSNHMGIPNGYNVNSKATYIPDAYGYAAIGGKKTSYQGVRGHLGGMKRVNGVSYTGHNGLTPYNYGTHEEHVAVPGMTKVTYTNRYPVHPAYGMFPTYGAYNSY